MTSGQELIGKARQALDLDLYHELHWSGTFAQYLDLVRQDPTVTRSAFERIYDMVLSYGTREYVALVDAIDVYERRRTEALAEIEHCEKRIAELRKKWNRALKGRVLRSGTSVASTNENVGGTDPGRPVMDEKKCTMCGSTKDLTEDANMEGVFQCKDCLDRVAKQNRSIDDGMDDEPPVEY